MTQELEVVYGDSTFNVPASTDIAKLKVAMAENFPELQTAVVEHDSEANRVVFKVKAGTKG